jgi:hypothetical protein
MEEVAAIGRRVLAFLEEDRPWRSPREFGANRGGAWATYPAIVDKTTRVPRQGPTQRQPKARRHDFGEVDLWLTPEQAQTEVKRCLHCAVCCDYRASEEAYAEIGALDHVRAGQRLSLISLAVLMADESEAPELGE